MKQFILLASVIALMGFTLISCKRSKVQNSSWAQVVTSNLVSDVKSKTDVELPNNCRLIFSENSPRLDADVWLFEIESSNSVRFPKHLELLSADIGRDLAKTMESMGDISIDIPKASYFAIWGLSNTQCKATLIMTSSNGYLRLERFY